MGSSTKNGGTKSDLVTITTANLKDRLNRLYECKQRSKTKLMSQFDHLWDLKEHALLEKKTSVDVPRTWMDELDHALAQGETRSS